MTDMVAPAPILSAPGEDADGAEKRHDETGREHADHQVGEGFQSHARDLARPCRGRCALQHGTGGIRFPGVWRAVFQALNLVAVKNLQPVHKCGCSTRGHWMRPTHPQAEYPSLR